MIKGIAYAILYYVVGLSIAGLLYLLAGDNYGHAPGAHHMFTVLTMVCGLFWMLAIVRKFFLGKLTEKMKGMMIVHSFVLLGFCFFLYAIISSEQSGSDIETGNKLSIEERGDSIIVYDNGNLIYLEVGDSVLLNLDSVEITTYESTPSIIEQAAKTNEH